MAIEGFDYKTFADELANQAGGLIPAGLQDFQKTYVINTIKNFATLCGEAIYNDDKLKFNSEQAMLITQIIAEWSFHKSIDVIKAGILPDYWDGIMQKIAFTIFEIAKQAIAQNVDQDEILRIVEHHVKKTYESIIADLKQRKVIDGNVSERALKQSNIDDMMQQMQQQSPEEKTNNTQQNPSAQANDNKNTKVLKLASVALLLKRVSQDKVQAILNKFDDHDAKTVIQYMKMSDLEEKVDQGIAMKCLQEIKTNLPEPKFISSQKIIAKVNNVFSRTNKEEIDKIVSKERLKVKEFIARISEGEDIEIPSKVANIIAQHLEESIS